MKNKIYCLRPYLLLHTGILVYALAGVCSKLAAGQKFFSWHFFLLYGLVLALLCLYAVIWQQVLKHITLTTAFLNKAVTVIWGMILGVVLFRETITLNMVLGAILVLIGVGLVVTEKND